MKLNEVLSLSEARGSGSFDYRYWFWAKKGSTYGFGYARQDVQVDIVNIKNQAETAIENIKSVLDSIENDTSSLEVVETKIKANTKRLKGIVDLFHSPIVIHWLTDAAPKVVEIPRMREGDVTDLNGRRIDIVDLFSDEKTREFVETVIDWDKVKINDEEDTLNTIVAKFISNLFEDGKSKKNMRTEARTKGLDAMKDLYFKAGDIEVKSFSEEDYKLLPQDLIGSKKIVSKIKEIKEKNFKSLLGTARKRL